LQVDSEGDSIIFHALLTPSVKDTGEEGWKPWRLSLLCGHDMWPFAHDFFGSFREAHRGLKDWAGYVLSEWWPDLQGTMRHDFNRDIDRVTIVSAEDYMNESMKTTCRACGHEFSYAHIPESQMGAVECPNCHSTINQEGHVLVVERKLTTKARKALSKGQFVFPGERRYPIHDKAHARNALSRVSQHGTPVEKAKVRAAVHRKFPNIGKDTADESVFRICRPRPLTECSGKCTGCGCQSDHLDHFGPGRVLCPRCSSDLPARPEDIDATGYDRRRGDRALLPANRRLESQERPLSIVEKICIVILKDPEVGKCSKCGMESQELRPYGESGALICYKCGMEDESGTSKRFLDLFHSAIEAANNFEKQRMLIDPYPHLRKPNVNG